MTQTKAGFCKAHKIEIKGMVTDLRKMKNMLVKLRFS